MATQLLQIEPVAPPSSEREQFLAKRKLFIGGSDDASLFNEGWGCARRLFYDKTDTPQDYPRTPAELEILERGTKLEDFVVVGFQEKTGLRVRTVGTAISKKVPSLGVNMDRQIIGATVEELLHFFPGCDPAKMGPTGALECKTANEWMFKKFATEGVAVDYVLQMQHTLAVKGYQWGFFAVLEVGSRLRTLVFPMLRNEELIAEIERRGAMFWRDHVEAGVIPDALPVPDKRCKSCLWRKTCLGAKAMEIPADESDIPQDDTLAEIATDYKAALANAAEADAIVETIKGLIQERIGQQIGAIVPGAGVGFSWKKSKAPVKWDTKAVEGTAAVIAKTDIPDGTICHATDCVSEAAGIIEFGPDTARRGTELHYVCDVHALKGVKDGGVLVARKGVSKLILNCKTTGTPARPFKIFNL